MEATEDEVAFTLLKGDMEDVVAHYDEQQAVEETLANVTVGGKAVKRLTDRMLGDIPTKQALGRLIEYDFIDGFTPTPRGRAVTRHFLDPESAFTIIEGVDRGDDPFDIVADVELLDEHD